MGTESTRAVFVRMPERIARKLDRAAERLGVSKRDVLTTLVNDHLDVEGDTLLLRVARADETSPPASDVLTVDETAALLRAPVNDVVALIDAGALPARRIGSHWRLSRQAVLAWLAGDGPAGRVAGRP